VPAPGTSDAEDRQYDTARRDIVPSARQQQPVSFAARYSPSFSLLQPSRISVQAPLGGQYAGRRGRDTDLTGSIEAGDIADEMSAAVDRRRKYDRPVAGIKDTVPPAEPRVAKPAPIAKPAAIAPVVENTHRTTPKVQLAYAAGHVIQQDPWLPCRKSGVRIG